MEIKYLINLNKFFLHKYILKSLIYGVWLGFPNYYSGLFLIIFHY